MAVCLVILQAVMYHGRLEQLVSSRQTTSLNEWSQVCWAGWSSSNLRARWAVTAFDPHVQGDHELG